MLREVVSNAVFEATEVIVVESMRRELLSKAVFEVIDGIEAVSVTLRVKTRVEALERL
jgi:hypothetical protein